MVFSYKFFKSNKLSLRRMFFLDKVRQPNNYGINKIGISTRCKKFDFSLIERIPFFSNFSKDELVITPFHKGSNNKNYKVSVRNKHFVLRIPSTELNVIDKIDRHQEKLNLELTANLGLCPRPLYFDIVTGVQLRPFIEGEPLTPDSLTKTDIVEISTILKKTHTSPLFSNNISIRDLFKNYEHILIKENFLACKKLFQMADEALEALSYYPLRLAPSHFDPHPGNFIKSKQKLFLLDWEFSGNTDPTWDLSFLSTSTDLNEEEDEILLKTYYGNTLTIDDKNRLLITKPLSELFVTARLSCFLARKHDAELQNLQENSLNKTVRLFANKSFEEALLSSIRNLKH